MVQHPSFEMEYRRITVHYARTFMQARDLGEAIGSAREVALLPSELSWHAGAVLPVQLHAVYSDDRADPLAIASQPYYPDAWSWTGADLAKQWRHALRTPAPPLPPAPWEIALGRYHQGLVPEFSEEGFAEFERAQLRVNTQKATAGCKTRRL